MTDVNVEVVDSNVISVNVVDSNDISIDVAGGLSASTDWGNINGTLSDQTDLQTELDGKLDSDGNHSSLTLDDGTNPHSTTKSDVGLSNVPNTDCTDADNISDGSTNAIITLTQETNFGTAYSHSQVTSGNPHSVSKSDVSLGNVDNTSDLNKPVSTATQTAIDNSFPDLVVASFSDTTGGQTLDTSDKVLNLDSIDISDSNYSLVSDIITVTNAYTYEINYGVTIDFTGNATTGRNSWVVSVEVEPSGGGGYSVITPSTASDYWRETSNNITITKSFFYEASAGDKLRIVFRTLDGTVDSVFTTVANQSNINLKRVK